MALQTHLAVGLVLEIASLEIAWVWPHLAAAVATDTGIPGRVAGLARLQVSACFGAVIRSPVLLAPGPQRIM